MRNSVKKVLVLLAVVMSLFAVQSAWAKCPSTCDITVTGTVSAINYDENSITVGQTTVYGIPFSYVAKWLGLELSVDSSVTITAKQCPSTGKLMACTLSVDGSDPITLRQGSLKKPSGAGTSAGETSALSIAGANCTCDCNCYCVDETNCDCKCDCLDCPENQNQYKKGRQ